MPTLCSLLAAVISFMRAFTLATLVAMPPIASPASCTCATPISTRCVLVETNAFTSLAAVAERWARARTSDATTAKPRPWSPARAASTAALSARMLVWKAMPSMTPMMSRTFREASSIWLIVATTFATVSLLLEAARVASSTRRMAAPALSAFWRTVEVSCSMDAAVC